MTETFPIPFGRYQLLERLAVGGMAELFLARDRGGMRPSDLPVVIKRLLPHMASQSHFKDMFLDEAKLTKRLNHPKIAQTYDFGRHGEQLFIAMEFVDGIDALALLRECAHRKVRLPPEIAVFTAREVLDALDFAHTQKDDKGQPLGVVHRDISPSNVLLGRSGDIKLVDFGIARASQRSHHTKDGTLKGKYGYMSPEQVIDDVVDARSDLFSVGVVLAELLTGRRLFAAPNELDVLLSVRDAKLDRLDRYGRHIGVDLDRILRKALRKPRDERFSTAAEFRDALNEWMHLHHHDITNAVIAEVVDSFYEDAWKRKRGMVPAALWQQYRSEGGQRAGTAPGPRLVRETAEVVEIHGIPAGQAARDSGTLPVISIDDADSAPIEARAVSGAIEAPAGVVSSVEWGETERMDSAMARLGAPPHEPITIELTDMTGEADIAESVAEFTPEPLLEDISAVPRLADDVPSRPRPPSHRDKPMSFASITDAMGALVIDDPDTLHERDRAAAAVAPANDESGPKPSAQPSAQPAAQPAAGAGEAAGEPPSEPPSEPVDVLITDLGQPDDSGDFSASPPIGVLYRLAVSRASGLLVVGIGGIRKEIYFREGIPEYVSSNVTNELFGEYLVQEGVLSSGELSMALAMMPRYKNRLGDTLVGLNLLTPLEVLRYLTRQVRKKLVDVCTWGRGSFAWYAGRENTREAFPLDLNAFEVLGAGALETPDEVIDGWLAKTGDTRPRLVRRGRVRPEVFQLGTFMRDVCRAIDGNRTLADLRADFDQRDQHDRFVRVLYLLTQTDLAVPA